MPNLPDGIVEPPHPSGRELTDFERSLCRVRLIGHEAHLLVCGLTRREDRKTDGDLLLTLQNYSLILVCRFLEIWAEFQGMARDNRRVKEIAQAVSPFTDRINAWPGLRDYRNWVLAHSYRVRREPEFVPPWVVLHSGRVPVGPPEMILVLECVRLAVAGVCAHFGDIYMTLSPVLYPGEEPLQSGGALDGAAAQAERVRLASEVNDRLKHVGVDLNDPVFREFRCTPA